MRRITATSPRWLGRAALAAVIAAMTGIAWTGYGAGESQATWAALWSLCAPTR